MIWNESVECMDREQLREIQSRRLVKMAEYVYHNTPFYRKKFQEMGLEPGDIKKSDCPYPCLFRYDGKARCSTLYP